MQNKNLVIHLTPRQEIEILDSLIDTTILGSGSSRAVYDLDENVKTNLLDELGLLTPYRKRVHYVVKLSLGIGGRTQSDNEYAAYVAHGDTYPLAPLLAAGQFILIMEKLGDDEITRCMTGIDDGLPDGQMIEAEVLRNYHIPDNKLYGSYDKPAYELEEDCDLDEEALAKLRGRCEDAATTINDLDSLFGTTSDNLQIGVDGYGCYLAYDYGFRGDGWGSTATWGSRLSNWVDDSETMNLYINKLIAALQETEDAYAELEYIEHDVVEGAGYEN